MVFAVREGNPKNIKTWDDLIKPGVEHRHAQPGLVGRGPLERARRLGPGHRQRRHRGRGRRSTSPSFFANVVALPGSGRDATTAFLGGTGDVLMAYENEAILAHQNGEEFDYIIPDTTMLIENPGAVLIDADPKAKEWLDFVLSEDGQRSSRSRASARSSTASTSGEVEGANDPTNPFPDVEEPADRRRRLRELERRCRRSSSTRRTGIVTKIIAESGKAE